MIKASMPFYMLWLNFKMLFLSKPARDGFKTEETIKKLDALKNVQMIPEIPTELVKKRAKDLTTPDCRLTFNDVLMTALSKSMHDYLRQNTDDKLTKEIVCACPFSLRRPPQELGDFEFNNDFAIIPLPLRLVDSI